MAIALAALLLMIFLTLHALRLNRRLVLAKQLVENARNGLEQEVRERTAELRTANKELSQEIAERRAAEDAVRKSEKYIREITASLGEGVYVLNAQGETTFMNPEAEALLGWSEKELLHKNIHDAIHNRRADGSTLPFEDCEMRKVIVTGVLQGR